MRADRGFHAAVYVVALVAVFAALWLAGSVFAPVAFALFIIAVVWPLQRALQSRLPRSLALTITILVTAGVLAALLLPLAWWRVPGGRALIAGAGQFQTLSDHTVTWLEGHGIAIAALWAEHFNIRWVASAAQEIAKRVNTAMSFSLIVFVYVLLGLLEVDDAASKIRAMDNHHAARI